MIYDLVIVGGGVVGLTLAALVADSSLKILVIEKNLYLTNTADYDVRCSAINLQSSKIFEKLGVLEKILASAKYGVFEKIALYAQQSTLEFNADDLNIPFLGYILQNQAMSNALLAHLSKFSNVRLLAAHVISVDPQNNCLMLSDNVTLKYNLLAISDGRYSKLRQLLGIDTSYYDYQDSAIVAVVRTARPCAHVASQFFVDKSILAFLPLAQSDTFSIVLSQSAAINQAIIDAPDELGSILSQKSAYNFGYVEVISNIANFALAAQHANNYVVHNNIVLVGDSAHSIHPLAGQGLNLGLADAACLANFINRQQTSYAFLRKYERTVKMQNTLFLHSLSGIRSFFKTPWLPTLALQTMRHLPALKAVFMKNAVYGL